MPFKFEKLDVWAEASDSISLNIAEGSTGQSDREFYRFLGYAVRSGVEVVGALYLAKRKRFITPVDFTQHYNEAERIIVKVQALRKSIRR